MKLIGKIKFFNAEKGYGFICASDGTELFFHASKLKIQKLLEAGDEVEYETFQGRRGKEAQEIKFIKAGMKTNLHRPYFGKATVRTESGPVVEPALLGAGLGAMLGPIGALVGGALGALIGGVGGSKEVEITSPCLRCGGSGQVTSRAEGMVGFQCRRCLSFWKKHDVW